MQRTRRTHALPEPARRAELETRQETTADTPLGEPGLDPIPAFNIEDVVARVGHELRNPLASIQSGIQLAQVLTSLPDDVAGYLAGALAEVARIDVMLRNLNHLVRLAPARPRLCRLADLIALGAPRHSARANCPAVRLEGPTESVVETDPDLLQVVLDALTARAVAVTPAAGEVLIRWDVGEQTPAWIEVQDGGQGGTQDSSLASRWLLATWPGGELGLHLAVRACTLLGGRLTWSGALPRGHRIRVTLVRG